MLLAGTEVALDAVQSLVTLGTAIVAAWVTIRTRQIDAKLKHAQLRHKRCQRFLAKLRRRIVKLEAERVEKVLDKRPRRR